MRGYRTRMSARHWREHLQGLRAEPTLPLPPPKPRDYGWLVGSQENGDDYIIPYTELEQTHVHVMGPSGFGKSYTLYNLICQSILDGHGVAVIDPDSSLVEMVLNFVVQRGIEPDRVVMINPLSARYTPRLNPLQSWGGVMGMGTDAATGALLRVAGETDFSGMQRLRKYVRAALKALERSEVPLAYMPWFCALTPESAQFRTRMIEQETNEYLKLIWRQFSTFTKRTAEEHIESTVNRVCAFAEDERVLRMMSFPQGNVDWLEVINEGKIALINLGQEGELELSREDRRLVGAVTLHGIVNAAFRRSTREKKRFFCFCDEFGSYVSEDVAEGLDRCRKKKVHLVVSHQRIGQIEFENPNVMEAIIEEARVKIIFGGLGRENAKRMAEELFTGDVDGDEVKRSTQTTAFRPYLTWVDIYGETWSRSTSEGESYSEGESETEGGSSGRTAGHGSGLATLYTPDQGIVFWGESGVTTTSSFHDAATESSNWSRARSRSHTTSTTETTSWGGSRVRAPLTRFEEFLQPAQLERYTLEEQWEKRIAQLKNLPRRTAIVRITGRKAELVKTVPIAEVVMPIDAIAAYETSVYEACPYVGAASLAEEQFQQAFVSYGLQDPNREPIDVGVPIEEGGVPAPTAGVADLPARRRTTRTRGKSSGGRR